MNKKPDIDIHLCILRVYRQERWAEIRVADCSIPLSAEIIEPTTEADLFLLALLLDIVFKVV